MDQRLQLDGEGEQGWGGSANGPRLTMAWAA